jgi:hypothetical protein
VILAHHGYGEELVLYALAGGTGSVPALILLWRARVGRVGKWLRRR